MGNTVVLWARGGYIRAMFEYLPYPADLARSSVLLFSSNKKHIQASSVVVGRLVILILAVSFGLGPVADVS